MSNKENNIKEKFRQALISTAKVISDDYKLNIKDIDKNLSSKNVKFFEIDNLTNKSDFIKLRAEADSAAVKKNFLIKIYSLKIYLIIHLVNLFIILLKKLDMNF